VEKSDVERDRIKPYEKNRLYWQYKGQPVVLLGGTVEDNIFQIPDLEEHLRLLASVGGNYARCTLSSRDEGNVWPFERDSDSGKYDLTKPGREYWERFERCVDLAERLGIILQVELWDRFDFARGPWQRNPYNPKRNVNYSAEDSTLPKSIDAHPGRRENPFFGSVPALQSNELVLKYQRVHIDELVRRTVARGNVLYCMDNETNEAAEWGAYWAEYLKAKMAEAGRGVEVTEMWDAHDLTEEQHRRTWEHPETYTFLDISQNSHSPHSRHWDNMQWMRTQVIQSGHVRPINTVKIYGANTGKYGSGRDGQERFWRNIVGGLASSRFHRPPSGLGLGKRARQHITSLRMLVERVDVVNCEPHTDLVRERSWNEAYCTTEPGKQYAVFFPDGGDVYLDVNDAKTNVFLLWWLDIMACRWLPPERVPGDVNLIRLRTPRDDGFWAAAVKPDLLTSTGTA